MSFPKPEDIDDLEIQPLVGMDTDHEYVETYAESIHMEPGDPNTETIVAWGVYAHLKAGGVQCLFDVPDQENAKLAEALLKLLYHL